MSEPLPSITDEDARMLASAQSFERGVGYFRSSALSTPGVWGTNCASTVTARDTPLTGYRPGWGLTESKMHFAIAPMIGVGSANISLRSFLPG